MGENRTPIRTDELGPPPELLIDGPDPVTGLGEYNGEDDRVWLLPRTVGEFDLGASGKCSVSVPGRPGLSAKHLKLLRQPDGLYVEDQKSTNGLIYEGRRVASAYVVPGHRFMAMPVIFVALNDEMLLHRPTLIEVLGRKRRDPPDELMIDAVFGSAPLLLLGDPTCDLDRLARAMHAMSPRRYRSIVEVTDPPLAAGDRARSGPLARSAAGSTLVLSIGSDPVALDPQFLVSIFNPSFHIRVIAIAPSVDAAIAAMLPSWVANMRQVQVSPLAHRAEEIERLIARVLDRELAALGAPFRTADLTAPNLQALRSYHWPENFVELRRTAAEVNAYVVHGDFRRAGEAIGEAKSTMQRHFKKLGLTDPLLRAR